ncbi:hypothetical protein NBRC116187_20140 [Halopseudomonas sabulinigri]|uniref:Uncharacterized protein n=1 Tax=Halopseudomonas sabulinigri TaxID=472181 RepID=A0ABP9ZQC0_9GAMM
MRDDTTATLHRSGQHQGTVKRRSKECAKAWKKGDTGKLGGNPTSHTPAHDMTAAAAPFRA